MYLSEVICILPVAVAEAERSFSTLTSVKSFLRTTMAQEPVLAIQLDFNSIIDNFANKKARKAIFSNFYNETLYKGNFIPYCIVLVTI